MRTHARPSAVIEELRERISKIEGVSARKAASLPFGIAEIDTRLPGGGLALPRRMPSGRP